MLTNVIAVMSYDSYISKAEKKKKNSWQGWEEKQNEKIPISILIYLLIPISIYIFKENKHLYYVLYINLEEI